jgi:hypothetical protein
VHETPRHASRTWRVPWLAALVASAFVLAACSAPTTGTLAITVDGLPGGVEAAVLVIPNAGTASGVTGSERLTLAPGTYIVDVSPTDGFSHWSDDSTTVTIVAGQTTPLTIEYVPTVIVSYFDGSVGVNELVESLTATDADYSHFTTQTAIANELDAGDASIYFVFQQDFSIGAALRTSLANAVAAGARVVFTHFEPDTAWQTFGVTSAATHAPSTVTFSGELAPSLAGAIGITNPGYGTFAMNLTPDAGTTTLCTTNLAGVCAVRANDGRTLALGFLTGSLGGGATAPTFCENVLSALLR